MQETPGMPQKGRGRRARGEGAASAPEAPGRVELRTETIVLAGIVALAFLALGPSRAPAWAKDLPPAFEKLAGPWRGKGSFGKAPFGLQSRHR